MAQIKTLRRKALSSRLLLSPLTVFRVVERNHSLYQRVHSTAQRLCESNA